MATNERFFYPHCQVLRIVDGDTIDVRIMWDIGFGVKGQTKQRIRIGRIDAPEDESDTKEAGAAATARLVQLIPPEDQLEEGDEPTVVAIETFKLDDFGRYVGDVWHDSALMGTDETINDRLVDEGLAVYKTFGKTEGVPRSLTPWAMTLPEVRALHLLYGIESA